MKKSVLLFVFIYSILLSAGAQTSTAPSGSGTSADPYQIATLDNLYWLSQTSSAWSSYFIQTANIDASNTKTWDSGNGFSPIGNSTTNFTGYYYGKDHYINGLYIHRTSSSYIGLFGYTFASTIDSLEIINADINGAKYVGALVGYSSYSSTIDYCYSTGSVHGGTSYIGGLVGYNLSPITNCYSGCNISGLMYLGGLVGLTSNPISYCYATGNVTATYGYAGGFAGSCTGYYAKISSCYSTGLVTDVNNYKVKIDGFVGEVDWGTITGCYFNTQTSGKTSSYATALTTAQMKKPANLTGLGSFSTIWEIREDSTYAALRYVNNAPFAMPDTLITYGSTLFYPIFNNDYDYETLQNKRVFKFTDLSFMDSEVHYTDYKTYICLGSFVLEGQSRTLGYCVGEVLAPGDTLWGNSAKVVLKEGANSAPTPVGDSFSIKEDSTFKIAATLLMPNDSDPDNDTITFLGSSDCCVWNGKVLSIYRKDSVIYVPNANWYGTEKVNYCISDGRLSLCTHVTITVIPVNDVPVLSSVATGKTTNEDTPVTITMSDVTATDVENDKLHIVLFKGDNYTFIDSTLTTALNYNGTISVPVAVSDGVDTSNVMTMTITVDAVTDVYTITATAGDNGSISPSGIINVNEGNNQGFTITANTGYHVVDVLVDGSSVGAVSSYTFSNVTANHTIAASFAETIVPIYTITATAGTNGSISPLGSVSVTQGNDQSFTIIASTGYHIADVLVDGSSVGAVGTYTFSNVVTNHTITANFAETTVPVYTITATAGENGSISPSGEVSVTQGSDQTFIITPNTGYSIATATYNNTDITGSLVKSESSYTYTVSDVMANGILDVAFATTTEIPVSLTHEIMVYPNPVKDIMYLKTEAGNTTINICITDMYGRQVLKVNNFNQGSLDLSALSNGNYIGYFTMDKKIIVQTIVKQ